ncbi:MAG: hypothetical protein ACLRIP_16530 [Blautia massiliensis (ex Durand et al. 2017)]
MSRIAQYEKGARSPKEKYLNALADIFEVSPHALAVPDIDSYVGLMHTLFTLEDLYGLHYIDEIDGELWSPSTDKSEANQFRLHVRYVPCVAGTGRKTQIRRDHSGRI